MEPRFPTTQTTSIQNPAGANFVHPERILATGKCGSGKTRLMIELINTVFRSQINRLIVVCPTYRSQEEFRVLDDMILRPKDVHLNPNAQTFDTIKMELLQLQADLKKKGLPQIATLVFVDDLAGTNLIHGGRISGFANFSIQSRHIGCSVIVISQQATAVSPAFRDNVTSVVAFPGQRKEEIKWLIREYARYDLKNNQMEDIIISAWNGYKNNENEWGKHFLTIFCKPREPIAYFADLDYHIHVTPQ